MVVAEGFVVVDASRCDLCGACVAVCEPLALRIEGSALRYEAEACTACGECLICCPGEALAEGP
ncbi:MAG: 4Fe-4S binding protein [Candidatus Coatesbacteria bacterium]|nr:MAG: 4Fe-4S binding protein [Candidatus Coatesbacteria bacterium]